MGTNSRLSPLPIIIIHIRTLRNTHGVYKVRDIVEHYIIPVVCGIVALYLNFKISEAIAISLVTITGIFAAFFFQLSISLLGRAASWSEGNPQPSRDTTRYASLLGEISANSSYSALIAILTAAFAVAVGISDEGWVERVCVSVTVVLLAHLVVTILFISVRVFLLTRARLIRARTGPEQ